MIKSALQVIYSQMNKCKINADGGLGAAEGPQKLWAQSVPDMRTFGWPEKNFLGQ
jgi:hypothetical protein